MVAWAPTTRYGRAANADPLRRLAPPSVLARGSAAVTRRQSRPDISEQRIEILLAMSPSVSGRGDSGPVAFQGPREMPPGRGSQGETHTRGHHVQPAIPAYRTREASDTCSLTCPGHLHLARPTVRPRRQRDEHDGFERPRRKDLDPVRPHPRVPPPGGRPTDGRPDVSVRTHRSTCGNRPQCGRSVAP
jgi:hypothetical protein